MKKPEFPIAREGLPFILFCGFVTLICCILGYQTATLAGLMITAFVTAFFRDPTRVPPEDETALVSPADGKIILVENIFDDRFLQEQVIKISIFMNIFNVHVNRMPYPGVVECIQFKPGKFYSADKNKAALHNEYCALVMKTDSGKRYGVVQVAGLVARRIVCWAEKGDRIEGGQRYGLIQFGSRVDLYLPEKTEVVITPGQKVKAGETIIGRMQQ